MFDFFSELLAKLLAFFYSIVPDYTAAISLLTVAVMVLLMPLTIKGTRSMLALQGLAPDIQRLQEKHKNDRQKLNEELMAIYRDNKISPLGGCLPLLMQFPVFILLYQVISGLTNKRNGEIAPKFVDEGTRLYRDLVAGQGRMESLGIDLAKSATDNHGSLAAGIPFYVLIVAMVLAQYYQQHQVASRAPQTDSPQAQQMKMLQRFLPLMLGVFSLGFPAALVVYWVMSSVFRIVQQWGMYQFDPVLKTTVVSARKETEEFLKEDTKVSGRAQKAPGRSSGSKSSTKKKRKGR